MGLIILASATDIDRWADTRTAQERLPELVRRLVFATTRSPTYVDFPAGEAIQLGGFDGVIELLEAHPFIPHGVSVWEIGSDANPKRKADADYEKRTHSQPPTGRGDIILPRTTFVFVTPRRWGGKAKWAQARRAEGTWKDVIVLDADDLETWAQQAAATHVWLSRMIGLVPAGADDIETVWADWAEGTDPTTSADLVLAGRAEVAGEILKWLDADSSGSLLVSAESKTDALSVVAAAIISLPDLERARILARTIVASSADALSQLAGSHAPLVIVPTYSPGSEIQRAVRGGHRVVIPAGRTPGERERSAHVAVPRVQRGDAEKALVAMSVEQARARELAGVARRSMLTFRRTLAVHRSLHTPAWSEPLAGPSLVPILLLGQFDEGRDADLQVLGEMAVGGLANMRQVLHRWALEDDPPIRRTGNVWYLLSKEDAWSLLSRYVTRDDLQRFAKVAIEVLREVHPKFELPPDQRWAASIHGKQRQYSNVLVTGIADTIALLGALENSVTVQGGASPSLAADRIVGELFESLAGDWRGWATLSHALPLLAEGAPDVFLRAVDSQVAKDENAARMLFQDDGDAMFSSSSHTGLLWALETLAWSPQHLAHVARVLATLDRLDPGGRILNRPGNSLRSIFLGWLPQSSADLETRLAVLNRLRKEEPEASWRLLTKLIPKSHDHSMQNPRPKWRDWGTAPQPTYGEIYRQTAAVVAWMIEDAHVDPIRWVSLVEALDNVRAEEFTAIVDGLSALLGRCPDDSVLAPISDALRELLSRHRSFPNADWALPDEFLNRVDKLFAMASPRSAIARSRWLFSNRPQLPEGREEDWQEHQKIVFERQRQAVRELHSELGLERLTALANDVERPSELGRVLASLALLSPHEEEKLLEQAVSASDGPLAAFGQGYAFGWAGRIGREAALERIKNKSGKWSDTTRGRLLLSQSLDATVFDIVDTLSPTGQEAFWTAVYPGWFQDSVVERGLRGILDHGRAHDVIDAAAMHLHTHPDLDPELLATALERGPSDRSTRNGRHIDPHDVGVVLDALERAVRADRFDELRLAQLEFLYLPALGHFTREPRALHKAMEEDPRLFIDAVKRAYRRRGEEPRELSPEESLFATNSHHLISSWRTPPGTGEGGLDAAKMNEWVDRARAELRESGRAEVGDQLIGQVMSGSPSDADGAWPLIPIRDLVERLASDDFETGLRIGKYNSRGVIMRDPVGGGDIERGEAETYERMAVTANRWSRTSAMLRSMAAQARAHAVGEDLESELRQDLED